MQYKNAKLMTCHEVGVLSMRDSQRCHV